MVQYKINKMIYIYTDFTSEYNVFAIICVKHLIGKYVGGNNKLYKIKNEILNFKSCHQ